VSNNKFVHRFKVISQSAFYGNIVMEKAKIKLLIKSFIISLGYVGLGTLSVLSIYPSSPLYGSWVLPTQLLTLPVSIWSFGIVFEDADAFVSVLVVQSIVLLLFWYFLFRWLTRRYKNKTQKLNSN
jgi:hypothetical protein